MKVYTTDKIRNVVLLGHGGSGKTTLAESFGYITGLTSRMGTVADGNTLSDYGKEEQKRGFSISASVIPVEWEGTKINFIDTPGYFDFVGEVEEAVSAAGAAIIVVNGRSGVEVGTKKAWDLCEKYKLPRIIYVSNMDIDTASYRQVIEDLTALYGKKIAPFHLPIRKDEELVGYVNVVSEQGQLWQGKEVVPTEVPDYNKPYLEQYRETLMEAVAETSEEMMDRYFAGETFSDAEIRAALRATICDGSIVPVTMGSSISCKGAYALLDDVIKYFPAPMYVPLQVSLPRPVRSITAITISPRLSQLTSGRPSSIPSSESTALSRSTPVFLRQTISSTTSTRMLRRRSEDFMFSREISPSKFPSFTQETSAHLQSFHRLVPETAFQPRLCPSSSVCSISPSLTPS